MCILKKIYYIAKQRICGATCGILNKRRASDSSPVVVNRNSHMSVFASTTDHRERPAARNLRLFIEEACYRVTETLNRNHFPGRDEYLIILPPDTYRQSKWKGGVK